MGNIYSSGNIEDHGWGTEVVSFLGEGGEPNLNAGEGLNFIPNDGAGPLGQVLPGATGWQDFGCLELGAPVDCSVNWDMEGHQSTALYGTEKIKFGMYSEPGVQTKYPSTREGAWADSDGLVRGNDAINWATSVVAGYDEDGSPLNLLECYDVCENKFQDYKKSKGWL